MRLNFFGGFFHYYGEYSSVIKKKKSCTFGFVFQLSTVAIFDMELQVDVNKYIEERNELLLVIEHAQNEIAKQEILLRQAETRKNYLEVQIYFFKLLETLNNFKLEDFDVCTFEIFYCPTLQLITRIFEAMNKYEPYFPVAGSSALLAFPTLFIGIVTRKLSLQKNNIKNLSILL